MHNLVIGSNKKDYNLTDRFLIYSFNISFICNLNKGFYLKVIRWVFYIGYQLCTLYYIIDKDVRLSMVLVIPTTHGIIQIRKQSGFLE